MAEKFNKLAGHVEREYEKEGMSHKKAEYIGKAVAGKVYREKQAKKKSMYSNSPHEHGGPCLLSGLDDWSK